MKRGSEVPAVSVVIPTYNSAWSIGRTLQSVLHQRLAEFEVIVVDDGSTDELEPVLRPFLSDARVRVVRQANRGLAGARNRGIAEARAPLVAPIDADDMWHPDFLGLCVDALARSPEAPFAFAYSFRMDENDFVVPFGVTKSPPRHDLLGLLSLNSVGNGSAAVYRMEPLLMCGGFDEEMGRRQLHGAEDWKLVLQLARKGHPVLVARHLVGYRIVEASMSQKDPARQLLAIQAVIADLKAAWSDVPHRHFRDAHTMMVAWLMPTYLKQRRFAEGFRQALRAYGLNPGWLRNPLLRRAHWSRLLLELNAWARGMRIGYQPLHLSKTLFEGERPFSYLAETQRGGG